MLMHVNVPYVFLFMHFTPNLAHYHCKDHRSPALSAAFPACRSALPVCLRCPHSYCSACFTESSLMLLGEIDDFPLPARLTTLPHGYLSVCASQCTLWHSRPVCMVSTTAQVWHVAKFAAGGCLLFSKLWC